MNTDGKYFFGIDPGLHGAVAILCYDGVVMDIYDTPTILSGGIKKRLEYDVVGMFNLLSKTTKTYRPRLVVLERLWSRPGQSAQSSFTLGRGVALWELSLVALGIPYDLVVPQRWQKEMLHGVSAKGKEASWVRARSLFPLAIPLLEKGRKKIHHGRSDALLLAEYARRQGG